MATLFRNYFFLFLMLFACIVVSCRHHTFYQKMDTISNETWNMNDTLFYELSISDSMQFYNFYIDIRNTTNYPYQNLYLFFTTQFPDSTVFTDTLNCILCDAYGHWTGKGTGIFKNHFIFKPQVRFPQKGKYVFKIQQAMRDVDLYGITNFGITLQYE